MIQKMESKSRMRVPIAARSPIRRARPCCEDGSLLARIAMKITLSTPSTISKIVSVKSASRPDEVKNASMLFIQSHAEPHFELYLLPADAENPGQAPDTKLTKPASVTTQFAQTVQVRCAFPLRDTCTSGKLQRI